MSAVQVWRRCTSLSIALCETFAIHRERVSLGFLTSFRARFGKKSEATRQKWMSQGNTSKMDVVSPLKPQVWGAPPRFDFALTPVKSGFPQKWSPMAVQVWRRCTAISIALCENFPDATCLNLGGGYKVYLHSNLSIYMYM